jgi:hypothetical protein
LECRIAEAIPKRSTQPCYLWTYQKAYDTCWRYAILKKLKEWKIDGKMLLFITNFTKETWLREEKNFYLPGFKVLRRDGPE